MFKNCPLNEVCSPIVTAPLMHWGHIDHVFYYHTLYFLGFGPSKVALTCGVLDGGSTLLYLSISLYQSVHITLYIYHSMNITLCISLYA